MKRRTEEAKQLTIYLPIDLHRALKVRAARESSTMTDIIVAALKQPKPAKAQHDAPTQGETANEATT